jgi:hypothetical protein
MAFPKYLSNLCCNFEVVYLLAMFGGRKEQNLSSKKDIENAFLLTKRSSRMLSMKVSITESCKFIPHCLLNFIVWLVNDSRFYQENNYEGTLNDILRKCISIAECVISLHKKQFTPFSVGLALQFHHEYGSKQLIETLNSYGFCANYTEITIWVVYAKRHLPKHFW